MTSWSCSARRRVWRRGCWPHPRGRLLVLPCPLGFKPLWPSTSLVTSAGRAPPRSPKLRSGRPSSGRHQPCRSAKPWRFTAPHCVLRRAPKGLRRHAGKRMPLPTCGASRRPTEHTVSLRASGHSSISPLLRRRGRVGRAIFTTHPMRSCHGSPSGGPQAQTSPLLGVTTTCLRVMLSRAAKMTCPSWMPSRRWMMTFHSHLRRSCQRRQWRCSMLRCSTARRAASWMFPRGRTRSRLPPRPMQRLWVTIRWRHRPLVSTSFEG